MAWYLWRHLPQIPRFLHPPKAQHRTLGLMPSAAPSRPVCPVRLPGSLGRLAGGDGGAGGRRRLPRRAAVDASHAERRSEGEEVCLRRRPSPLGSSRTSSEETTGPSKASPNISQTPSKEVLGSLKPLK